MTGKQTLHCSFCGKSQFDVKKLIAGPNIFICDECVELCADIINQEKKIKAAKELLRVNGFVVHDPVPVNKVKEAKKVLEDLGYTLAEPTPPETSLHKFGKFFRSNEC